MNRPLTTASTEQFRQCDTNVVQSSVSVYSREFFHNLDDIIDSRIALHPAAIIHLYANVTTHATTGHPASHIQQPPQTPTHPELSPMLVRCSTDN